MKMIFSISVDTFGYIYGNETRTVRDYDLDGKPSPYNCENSFRKGGSINIADIDYNDLENQVIKSNYLKANIELRCKDFENCLTIVDENNNRKLFGEDYSYYGDIKLKNGIGWDFDNGKDALRFLNALKYLIGKMNENKFHEFVPFDPFAKNYKLSNNHLNTKKTILSKNTFRIPLSEKNGVYNLKVNVNGVTTIFVLDSGAGESCMSPALENTLIINGYIKARNYLMNGLYRIADGSITECKRVMIPKLTVGNKVVTNVVFAIGSSNSPNLLGQSFLKQNSSWTLDNIQKILILN